MKPNKYTVVSTIFLKVFGWSLIVLAFVGTSLFVYNEVPTMYKIAEECGEEFKCVSIVSLVTALFLSIIVLTAWSIFAFAKSDNASYNIVNVKKPFCFTAFQAISLFFALVGVYELIWLFTAPDYEVERFLRNFIVMDMSLAILQTLFWIWLSVGFYFFWGAVGRVVARVVNAAAKNEIYERKINELKNQAQKPDNANVMCDGLASER